MVKVSDQKKSARVKQYFAETARKMIMEEGVEAVTVRKVAAEAGYSYATIYNHFENLDELLWYARNLLIQDIADHLKESGTDSMENIDDIKRMFHAYVAYYLQYPTVYRFFYFHKLDKSQKHSQSLIEDENYQQQFVQTFECLNKQGKYSPEDIISIGKAMIYVSHGILTLQFTENDAMTSQDVFHELDSVIDLLLRDL